MRKIASLVFITLAIVIVGMAQTVSNPASPTPTYEVQDGDTLYELAGAKLNDPELWKQVLKDNLFLQNPGRVFKDKAGRTIVILHKGEKLVGLEKLGILPTVADISTLGLATPRSTVPVVQPTSWQKLSLWALLLILAIVAILVGLWFLLRRFLGNAVDAGERVVPAGVTDQTVSQQFTSSFGRGETASNVRITNIVRGRMWGAMKVGYRNWIKKLRILNGEVGYRALIQIGSNPPFEGYMLQACGNDVRFSRMSYVPSFGFRFVADAAVPAPEAPVADGGGQSVPVVTEVATTETPVVAEVVPAQAGTMVASASAGGGSSQPQVVGQISSTGKNPVGDTPATKEEKHVTPDDFDRSGETETETKRRFVSFHPEEHGKPCMLSMSGYGYFLLEEDGDQTTIRFRKK